MDVVQVASTYTAAVEHASAENVRARSVTRHVRIDIVASTLTVNSASGPGMTARTLDLTACVAAEVDPVQCSIVSGRLAARAPETQCTTQLCAFFDPFLYNC